MFIHRGSIFNRSLSSLLRLVSRQEALCPTRHEQTRASLPHHTQEQNQSAPEIGLTVDRQMQLLLRRPDQPPDARILKVALVGVPNAGKSFLVNRLLGWRVSSVSTKMNTTRERQIYSFTSGQSQIVFLDTPGLVSPKRHGRLKLDRSMIMDPHSSIWDADCIVVVHDVSDPWAAHRLDHEVTKVLYAHPDKMSILVLNKIDKVRKKLQLLDLTRRLTDGIVHGTRSWKKLSEVRKQVDLVSVFERMDALHGLLSPGDNSDWKKVVDGIKRLQGAHLAESEGPVSAPGSELVVCAQRLHRRLMETRHWHEYMSLLGQLEQLVEGKSGWANFSHVLMASALHDDGVAELKDLLLQLAVPGDWMYHSSFVTDQSPQSLAEQCVREKLLDYLPHEIPYHLRLVTEYWDVQDGLLCIVITIMCRPKQFKRDSKQLLGRGGSTLKQVAMDAKQELMNMFRREVSLKLVVR